VRIRTRVVLMLVAVAALALSRIASSSAQGEGPNLLQDGDFEWSAPWPPQGGRGEIQAAPQWRAWWVETPPKSVPRPYNCLGGKDNGCYWAVPEFTDAKKMAYAYRVHGGLQAQKYFSYGRMHQAGLMQKVSNIQPGARLRFSIYIQAWMCYKFEDCQYGKVSDQPSNMHLMIGIDPNGGENPYNPDIVWSPEQSAWDAWVLFQVEAVAKNNAVTVFTHSRADWDWARANNDVYLDDASLVVVGQAPAAQPTTLPKPQPPAQAAQPAQPQATQPRQLTFTPAPTRSPTPTITPTPTDTALPTETPVRRVATLPPEDTPTPAPVSLWSDSPGNMIGLVFLGVAGLMGVLLTGVFIRQRGGPKAG